MSMDRSLQLMVGNQIVMVMFNQRSADKTEQLFKFNVSLNKPGNYEKVQNCSDRSCSCSLTTAINLLDNNDSRLSYLYLMMMYLMLDIKPYLI